MTAEGAIGLVAGYHAASTSLIGWALSSVVEGLASVIVIWRLTGSRTLSPDSEQRAQRMVAISFWLLAPYVAALALSGLLTHERSTDTTAGMVAGSDRRPDRRRSRHP